VLQHTVHDAYDSELELELEEAEMQVTVMRIDLTSFVAAAAAAAAENAAENAVQLVTFSESLRENAVELGVAMFAAVPSDDDVYSKFGAMQIVVDVAVAVAAGAVVAAADAAVAGVVEAVALTGCASVVVLAASEIAESFRYYLNFQENLLKIKIFLRGHF